MVNIKYNNNNPEIQHIAENSFSVRPTYCSLFSVTFFITPIIPHIHKFTRGE